MGLQAVRRMLERSGVFCLALVVGACAGGGPPSSDPLRAESVGALGGPGCILERIPLTSGDGVQVYVEPEDLVQLGSSYLVVGTPSFEWAPGTPRGAYPLTVDRHLAARFTLDGRATLIEQPVQDTIGSVRTVPLDGEGWGVLFDIERRVPSSRGLAESIALWYAEHDGTGWSLLEPVPMPEQGELRMHTTSEIVRVGDELVWIAPVLLPDRTASTVVEYTRRDGAWHRRVIGDDWVEIATLAYREGSGLWMARSGPVADRTRGGLRVYRRDSSEWRLVREVYTTSAAGRAAEPQLMLLPDGVSVSWRVVGGSDGGAYAVVGLGPESEGTPVELDRAVFQVVPLPSLDEAPRWLVTHANEDTERWELRILAPRPLFGAERLAAVPSPYPAFVAALARTPREALVVGAEVSPDSADFFVRSLVLRLSTSCT